MRLGETAALKDSCGHAERLQGKCLPWASLVASNCQQSLTPNASVGPVGAGFPHHSPELAEPPELILTFFLPQKCSTLADPSQRDDAPF